MDANIGVRPPAGAPAPKRSGLIVLIVLAVMVIVAAVVLLSKLPTLDRANQSAETTALPGRINFPSQNGQYYYPFGVDTFFVSGDRVQLTDELGQERYSFDIPLHSPLVRISNNYALVVEQEGSNWYLFDRNNFLRQGVIQGTAGGAAIDGDRYFAILQQPASGKGDILVYRLAEGSLQYTISFAESGYPIMFSFQPSAKSLDVLLLNTDRSEPVPLVKRYDLNGNLTAQFIPSDDLEIFAALAYDTAGHLVMGSSRCLLATDFISEQPVWRANFARVASFVGTSAGVAVLASDRADGPYNLYIIDSDGVCTLIGAAGDSVTPLAAKGSTVSWDPEVGSFWQMSANRSSWNRG